MDLQGAECVNAMRMGDLVLLHDHYLDASWRGPLNLSQDIQQCRIAQPKALDSIHDLYRLIYIIILYYFGEVLKSQPCKSWWSGE